MTRLVIAVTGAVPMVLAAAWLNPVAVAGQGRATVGNAAIATATKWTPRRTPDGQPDLQGFWTNTTYTPLQRPPNVTKEFYTPEEAIASIKERAASESELTEPGTVEDVHYDFTQFGLDRSQGPMAMILRTSLIFDPPDGRIPPMTPEGQKLTAERAEARKRRGAPTDAVQNNSLMARCILMDRAGPPMMGNLYNNNYQIVQAPGYVMFLVEMIHDVRIVPLDGRPQLPQNVRQLLGSSRGRWDGETLIVETANFTDKTAFQGSSENMRLTERFTRVDEDTIRYRFTVDDPSTWSRPWSAEVPWKQTIGPLFEHACHEGNYGMLNTLAGARAEEKRAAEAAKTPAK
ncbi:MAG: hypothetical protein HOP16_18935 [Acidobacteria bacterium]|nr:hypothetical protein [Acidobacteriota bacterium]